MYDREYATAINATSKDSVMGIIAHFTAVEWPPFATRSEIAEAGCVVMISPVNVWFNLARIIGRRSQRKPRYQLEQRKAYRRIRTPAVFRSPVPRSKCFPSVSLVPQFAGDSQEPGRDVAPAPV